MMINLTELREHFSMEEIRRFAEEKRERLLLPDQDIITALYGDRVKLLDSMIYNLSDRTLNFYNADPDNEPRDLDWVRQNSVVIHYFGRNKPWKEHYHGVLDVFYQEVQA
jgi:lipopolysaccharide biosynthesis glycosyltransferase